MNRYEKYNNSELSWLETIPEHWDLKRIARVFDIRKEKNSPIKTKEILSLSAKYGVSLYSDKKEKGGNKPKEDLTSYNLCYPGDILINCMNIVAGSVGISNYFGAISPVYYPLVNMNQDENCTRYMEYVFRNYDFQRSLVGLGKGIQMSEADDGRLYTVRMRISWDMLKTQLLPIPPMDEQEQIANYLDWKINEIDRLIQIEKEKIKELNQIMQFAIDSGYKILNTEDTTDMGIKIKFLANQITQRSSESRRYIALENIISKKGMLNISFNELEFNSDGILVEKDMVIFGKLRPYLAKAIVIENKAVCSSEFLVLKPHKVLPLYLKYLMLSSKFIDLVDSSTYGTKMPRVNADFILNLKIVVPDLSEQKEIVERILEHENKVNKAIEIILRKIISMEYLKQSLISEVVTGKIDVRNVVIPEYEKVTLLDDEIEEFDEMEGIEDGD